MASGMEPLDLTARPPRSPYQKTEGLFMVPRTIDKLRAKLPGGKIGGYTIRGMSTALPGLSLVLLDGVGVPQERLLEVVAGGSDGEEGGAMTPHKATTCTPPTGRAQ